MSPGPRWTFIPGHFTGSERDDILRYNPTGDGTIWVGKNTGKSFDWGTGPWSSVSPRTGWTFIAGKFTGRAVDDIAGYDSRDGSIWMGRNTGSGFDWGTAPWTTVSPVAGWSLVAGKFTGNVREDILRYHPTGDGTIWVGRNTGSGFDWGSSPWASVSPTSGWTLVGGRFSGGELDDLVGYNSGGNGTLWIGKNSGSGFSWKLWSESPILSPADNWSFMAGEFAGDGSADLVGYQPGDGRLAAFRNAKSLAYYVPLPWATVSPKSGWAFVAGKFTGTGRTDLMSYHGDGTILVGQNTGLRPEGYVWPRSAAPGQSIQFFISGVGSSTAAFFRHSTNSSGAVTSTQMGSASFTPEVHGIPDQAWAKGCNWPASFTYTIPAHWSSGVYSARLTSATGAYSYITFFVKPDPSQKANIVAVVNVNTFLAYNNYGGRRKYDGAANASFLRPDPFSAPIGETFEQHGAVRADLWILGWLEQKGFKYDLYTDIDFHNGIPMVSRGVPTYKKLIMLTHPEYWTIQAYANLQAYLNSGGSLLYLGGNGIYEIASYHPDQTGMSFLNGIENSDREAATFRSNGLPEINLLGIAYRDSGILDTPYRVVDASSPILAGTGLQNGDSIGSTGLNTGGTNVQGYSVPLSGTAAGWEVDTTTSIPGVSPPPGTDIVARASNSGGGAEMVYWTYRPGGGHIFSVGSISFGGSLAVDANLQKIVLNVLNLP